MVGPVAAVAGRVEGAGDGREQGRQVGGVDDAGQRFPVVEGAVRPTSAALAGSQVDRPVAGSISQAQASAASRARRRRFSLTANMLAGAARLGTAGSGVDGCGAGCPGAG